MNVKYITYKMTTIIEPIYRLPLESELWREYDNYVYNNTSGITWLKWQVFKWFGYRHDVNVEEAIFKVRFDTLKNQL